jgi:hypothetical protein
VDGANIDFSEHGSGDYSSNEMLSLSSSRLSADQNMRAKGTYALVNISSHPLSYNSSWYANRVCENRITKSTLREKYLHADALNSSSSAEIHKKETRMETESNFSGIAEFDSKGKDVTVDEMYVGVFKTRNKEIERYNSSTKHLSKDWLEGCDDEQATQIVDENDTENDAENNTETETGNETDEVGPSIEIIDPSPT